MASTPGQPRGKPGFFSWTALAAGVLVVLLVLSAWLIIQGQQGIGSLAAVAAALAMVVGVALLGRRADARTIRVRLRAALVLAALLPTLIVSVGSLVLGYVNGRRQAVAQIESIAALRDLQLTSWSQSLQDVLVALLNEQYGQARATVVLDLASTDRYSDLYSAAMRARMQAYVDASPDIVELMLIDWLGRIALSTDTQHDGLMILSESFYSLGQSSPFLQLPFRRSAAGVWPDESWVFASRPVTGADGKSLGLIVARVDPLRVAEILGERASLGKTGRVYLESAYGSLVVATPQTDPTGVASPAPGLLQAASEPALDARIGQSGVFPGSGGARVFAVYRRLSASNAVVVVEQGFSEALSVIYTSLALNSAVALLAVLLGSLGALLLARSITSPLVDLADTAGRVAKGELDRVAPVRRADEVGTLAVAFNAMTAQLRDLIANLEQRVSERTHALREAVGREQRRVLQLQASAKVSHDIPSILSSDEMLTDVAQLMKEGFGLRNVRVWLLHGAALTLCADATGKPLDCGGLSPHKGSLAERAMNANRAMSEPLVSPGKDPDPDAAPSDAGAELALPLRLGPSVMGILDLFGAQGDAFDEEVILVLQGLADQVAMAIENRRLDKRSRELAVMEERGRLARDLHDSVVQSLYSLNLLAEGWRCEIDAGETTGVDDHPERVIQITQQALKEMRLMVHELRPELLQKEGLLGALHHRLAAVESRAGIEAEVIADELFDLPEAVSEGLYRIAVEALNNTLRHASARHVEVCLSRENGRLTLEVRDDGCGFEYPVPAGKGGVGLAIMSERARALGGQLEVISAPGQGTNIKVSVPLAGADTGGDPG